MFTVLAKEPNRTDLTVLLVGSRSACKIMAGRRRGGG